VKQEQYFLQDLEGGGLMPLLIHLIITHATVPELKRKIQERGHKLYMDNYFSTPDLFDDLDTKQIYCSSTVRSNRKGMPRD
jgi:hypothetical protein